MKERTGLVHLYVGDGKGKTTAAIGLSVRARGAGRRVLVAQFLKGRFSSEREPLKKLGIDLIRTEELKKFTFQMNQEELAQAKEICNACLDQVALALKEKKYDLVVLDEVVDAVNCGLIELPRLLQVIQSRDADVELVMTGRNPKDEIVEIADYLTKMTAEKHPYQKGIQSREGIEF